MDRSELTEEQCNDIWIRILRLVQEGDPLFMCIDDEIISGLVNEDLIIIDPENELNMSGTILTQKGMAELKPNNEGTNKEV